MNRKRILIVLGVFALAIGSLALGRQSQSAQSSSPQKPSEIPDHVAYKHLFHHVVAFKKQAEEAEKQGKDGSAFRAFFKRKAELSDEQSRALNEVAIECDREVKQQDARAQIIIDEYATQYPNGKVPHGETPKPPPVELEVMTQERNAIILRARDRLHAAFGDEEFKRFGEFIKRRIAPNVKRMPPVSQANAQ
ncbi:MAG: hypothetical protein ABR577_01155 [Pyrinomonadaceae bacterium]